MMLHYFGNMDVGVCGDGGNGRTVSQGFSSALMLRRADMLAVFLLVLCLLGVDNARAEGEREIFSVEFYPTSVRVQRSGNPDRYRTLNIGDFRNSNESKYKFTFEGTTYKVEQVRPEPYLNEVLLQTSPRFPPDDQIKSKFYLHLGNKRNSQYQEANSLRFDNATVSGNGSNWSQSIGLNLWSTDRIAVVKITGPEAPNNSLRFATYPESPNDYTGRLEIFDATQGDDGQWKWVCDDDFGEEEAQVACRQLGLPTSGAAVWAMPEGWLDVGTGGFVALLRTVYIAQLSITSALLDDVDCDGDESRLIDCDHAGRGVNDCTVAEAVGVTCQE